MFLDSYVVGKQGGTGRSGGWKPTTEKSRKQTVSDLTLWFGVNRRLQEITAGDAEDWHQWLQKPSPKGRGLSAATAAKRLKDARQFFRYATRKKLITDNPFEGLKVPSQENSIRLVEVPRATVEALLARLQNSELRLIVALARLAGLRVPSETTHLRWRDVDAGRNSLHVFAPRRSITLVVAIGSVRCFRSWCPTLTRFAQSPAIPMTLSSRGTAARPRIYGRCCCERLKLHH